jgi:hypothetical protein
LHFKVQISWLNDEKHCVLHGETPKWLGYYSTVSGEVPNWKSWNTIVIQAASGG